MFSGILSGDERFSCQTCGCNLGSFIANKVKKEGSRPQLESQRTLKIFHFEESQETSSESSHVMKNEFANSFGKTRAPKSQTSISGSVYLENNQVSCLSCTKQQ